ncbi:hypothetical protein [Streptomyces afghaniensis]|uniref:hypothetical protein n=1 Tax=Streptomyces afghaniensis TaxID=66865 RepID=UPI002786D896|nr:hypothetical protein [Streptomyces afghaniensis]MDQ1019925.1 hypothetical protein [Streptomyces afghaniensis]
MNRYGAQAMTHWKENKPLAFQELEAPETFFTALGEEIATEIETRARELAGKEQEGEGYLQRLQRLNTSRLEAEGEVLRERVLLDVEPDQE